MNKKLKKILRVLFHLLIAYPLYLISFLSIRNKKVWVFSNPVGFRDNSKYFYIYLKNEHPELTSIWITSNTQEASDLQKLKVNAFYRWSLKGIYYSLKAKVYIFDSYVSDINIWTSGNALKVNLWHGVGIKNIERISTVGTCKKIFYGDKWYQKIKWYQYLKYPAHYIKPNLFLSTSPLMTNHFSKAFGIPQENCIEALYPRCQLFFHKDENNLFIYQQPEIKELLLELKKYSKSYLYTPTWRDSNSNFIAQAGFNLDLLNNVMTHKNQVFLFKLHPNTKLNIDINKYSNIRIIAPELDIYPILKNIDCLITDYSSIYYDFILMKEKEIVLFPFDYDNYITKDRDLAFDFNEYTEGHTVNSFKELMNLLIKENYSINSHKLAKIRKAFWEPGYIKNNEHIYQKINENAQ